MKKLIVSTSPHIHTKTTTARSMLDVIIALSPAAVASVVLFGLRALLVLAITTGAAVLAEFLFNLAVGKKQTVGDLSAAVTGLILALTLPVSIPLWQAVLGSVFAIVAVKCLFGGIGCNFANPAVTARVFLILAFTAAATGAPTVFAEPELVGGATPLEILKGGSVDGLPSLFDMMLGNRPGAMGETCFPAIALGAIYLVMRKVIAWEIPIIFVSSTFLLTFALTGSPEVAVSGIFAGGLLFGAVFMATDYVTSPVNRGGRMVFALGCGIITALIRIFGAYPGGVSFAILIMNILSPYIERLTARRPLGGVKNVKR